MSENNQSDKKQKVSDNLQRVSSYGFTSDVERGAYEAGWDCEMKGPNCDNCDGILFETPETSRAWDLGNRDAKAENELAKELADNT